MWSERSLSVFYHSLCWQIWEQSRFHHKWFSPLNINRCITFCFQILSKDSMFLWMQLCTTRLLMKYMRSDIYKPWRAFLLKTTAQLSIPVPMNIMSSFMQLQQQQQFLQFQNFQEHQKFSQFPQPSFPLNGQQLPGVKPLAVHTPRNKCQMSFLWVGIKTSNLYGLFK